MEFDLRNRTILLTMAGSHAYGTSSPTSDVDVKGVCVPPQHYRDGFVHHFEQVEASQTSSGELAVFHDLLRPAERAIVEASKVDGCVFDVRKFMSLAADANPNILDCLFCADEDVLLVTPAGQMLRDARQKFVSTKAMYTFRGYAISQLKRIETHRKWLLNPPQAQPTREEFDLPNRTVIPQDQLMAAQDAVQKKMDSWEIDFHDLDEAAKIHIREQIAAFLAEFQLHEDKRWAAAARAIGYDENFLALLDRERHYKAAMDNWTRFLKWKAERNPARAALEAKHGYDCYLDDTEFLTLAGWKRYDEVQDTDLLGTFNRRSGRIEYQRFTERVAKPYTGKIGLLTPRHSNCAVTLNHRMWVSPAHRSAANGFSWGYDPAGAKWAIQPLHELVKGARSCFHVRRAAEADPDDSDGASDEYLILMGAYVSEGCVGKRLADKSASVLRISQKKGNRLCLWMERLATSLPDAVRRFESVHDEEWRAEPCIEYIWTVAHREWASRLEEECGSGSADKRLPLWTRDLGSRQVRLLLDVMLAGDGTPHGQGWVYYTTSKRLADDVQTMCVSAGIVSAIWGPYPDERTGNPMYQVFIGFDQSAVATVSIREEGSSNFEVVEANDARIVCFTVPNEILITRRNGQVAIQGNTKHGMHLVRLMTMCREILTTGQVNVRRPDAAFLLSIRDGAWPYERLMVWAREQDEELLALGKTTTAIPRRPDRDFLDDLCCRIVSDYR